MIDLSYLPDIVHTDISTLSRDEWLELRRNGIGGSDVSVIYGINPWKTTKDLYLDKIGAKVETEEEAHRNWVAKERGHLLEELVAQMFFVRTGHQPIADRRMFRHPKYPWMLADCDYFFKKLDHIKGRELTFILECKTATHFKRDDWGTNENPKIPEYYEVQGRHYMAVTNVDGVAFACYFGEGDEEALVIRWMMRDLAVEEDIIEREEKFWKRFVLGREEPPYSESGLLRKLSVLSRYGKDDEGTVSFGEAETAVFREWKLAKENKSELEKQVKQAEERIALAESEILEILKGNRHGEVKLDGVDYTIGYTGRSSIKIPASRMPEIQALYPELYKEYVETSRSEWLVFKKVKPKKEKKLKGETA